MTLQEEFESTGYASWINSELYPDGKIYTKEYTHWLEQQVFSLRSLIVPCLPEEKKIIAQFVYLESLENLFGNSPYASLFINPEDYKYELQNQPKVGDSLSFQTIFNKEDYSDSEWSDLEKASSSIRVKDIYSDGEDKLIVYLEDIPREININC